MPPIAKPIRLSAEAHRAILARARGMPALILEWDGGADRDGGMLETVEPHHLRGVYPGQSRRSNPLVVPLVKARHEWLHEHPQEEERHRLPLLLKCLEVLAGDDVGVAEAAVRGALEYLKEQE